MLQGFDHGGVGVGQLGVLPYQSNRNFLQKTIGPEEEYKGGDKTVRVQYLVINTVLL